MKKSKKIQTTVDELACLQINVMIDLSHTFGKDLKGPALIKVYNDILEETAKIDLKRTAREFHELLDLCKAAFDTDSEG